MVFLLGLGFYLGTYYALVEPHPTSVGTYCIPTYRFGHSIAMYLYLPAHFADRHWLRKDYWNHSGHFEEIERLFPIEPSAP